MKQKTSITLSVETIRAVDELAGSGSNRSRIIEQAVREFLVRQRRLLRDRRDLELLNRAADGLNQEMEDVQAFQVDL